VVNYGYIALLLVVLVIVFFLVRAIVRAHRNYGRLAAWLVILVEAALAGGALYAVAKYVPGINDTWIGQQILLAVVGIAIAIVIGGGLVIALGRR
jgi:hypothetical protein